MASTATTADTESTLSGMLLAATVTAETLTVHKSTMMGGGHQSQIVYIHWATMVGLYPFLFL